MTIEELSEQVWNIVDQHSMKITLSEYITFLYDLADDAKIRRQAAQEDLVEDIEDKID